MSCSVKVFFSVKIILLSSVPSCERDYERPVIILRLAGEAGLSSSCTFGKSFM